MSELNDVLSGLMDVRLPYLPDSKAYIAITNAIELLKRQSEMVEHLEDGEPR